MPSKKSTPRRKAGAKGLTPNELARATSAADKAALETTCLYRGKTFYEGDTINFDNAEWQCRSGSWVKSSDINPNHLAAVQTAADAAALQVTCQFMSKTFYEGDRICYQQEQWQCTANGWAKTGNAC
jgi:hypothetical protein